MTQKRRNKRKAKDNRSLSSESALTDLATEQAKERALDWRQSASRILPFLLVALVVITAYSSSMKGAFLFDDLCAVVDNNSIHSLWPLSHSMWGPQDSPTAGRPLVNFSFALNYAIGELNVFSYHLLNVLLHLCNTVVLFALIWRTFRNSSWGEEWRKSSWSLAFIVSAIWAVHPLQTETVSYATQRSELLMAFFLLSTLYSARRAWDSETKSASISWQCLCVVCCALGMACKEVMVVAPVMVVIYDRTILNQPIVLLFKRKWPLYLGLASTWSILAMLLATNPRGASTGFGLTFTVPEYLTTQCWAITKYLKLTFWPVAMCGDYGPLKITEWEIWFPCFLLLLFLAGLTLLAWFRNRALSFLGVWFFLILAPSSSIVPVISEPIAERRMYLPIAAIIILVVVVFAKFIDRCTVRANEKSGFRTHLRTALKLVCFLSLVIAFAWTTYERNKAFRSQLAFWTDATQKLPVNARAFSALGLAYSADGQIELAKANLLRALQMVPFYDGAHQNLAHWYATKGLHAEALLHLECAKVHPRIGSTTCAKECCNLGKQFAEQGRFFDALVYFDLAMAMDPKFAEPYFNRGLLLVRTSEFDGATQFFRAAIEVDPTMLDSLVALADVYFLQERLDEAIKTYQSVLQRDPGSSRASANLAVALFRKGKYLESIQWSEKALSIAPGLPGAYHNLGDCYASLDRHQEAIANYMQCLSVNPNDVGAWFSSGKSHTKMGEVAEARICFERALEINPNSVEVKSELKQLDGK